MADIFDILSAINYNLQGFATKNPKKPKPYPRPNQKEKNTKHYGNNGVKDIRSWIKSKRH